MERGPTLPGVEEDDEDRIVLHVDLDCFYAACEQLREPDLEGEPVVVGMGYEPGEPDGAVATASYEARAFGVESAQAISTALERLPRAAAGEDDDGDGSADDADEAVGHYRPVDMAYYESVAEDVKAVLHDSASTVREVSIDEAYLDVTERTDWAVAEGYARHVKQRVEREVGLVASVGVAPTMHAAKVASDHDKPDGLVVVEPGEVESFLAPLPVEDLHGIGPVTAGTLREHDVETVADLADADREWIRERWGERGLELHDRARGRDPRVVEPRGLPKSLSRESAFVEPEDDPDAVRERLRALASAVADRARSKDAMYRTIGIKVVLPPYDVNTRERSLSGPVDDPELVERVALDLHEEFADDRPRKVGVRVSNLQFGAADQSTLGGWDGDADERRDGDAASEESSTADGSNADLDDERAELDGEQADVDDEKADPARAVPDATEAMDEADDGASSARPSDEPPSGHVLGLDFGDDAETEPTEESTATPAPDEPTPAAASDQTARESRTGGGTDDGAPGEAVGSAATGAATAESPSSGILDLDAAECAEPSPEQRAGSASTDSASDVAAGSTSDASTDSASDTSACSASETSAGSASTDASSPTESASPSESEPGLDPGQASLGAIADAVQTGESAAGDAETSDADGGTGTAERRPTADDTDGSDERRGPADRSRVAPERPDGLPPEQTTLLEFR